MPEALDGVPGAEMECVRVGVVLRVSGEDKNAAGPQDVLMLDIHSGFCERTHCHSGELVPHGLPSSAPRQETIQHKAPPSGSTTSPRRSVMLPTSPSNPGHSSNMCSVTGGRGHRQSLPPSIMA
jgi:hypothetical protein